MSKHKAVKVKFEDGTLDIDVKLAPLIPLLWAAGIRTEQCCQEAHPGLAYIEFPGAVEVEGFLCMAQRRYQVELEIWDEGHEGQHVFRVSLVVFFPTTDIPRLVKAFAGYAEKV
jgi:hypothetical protein